MRRPTLLLPLLLLLLFLLLLLLQLLLPLLLVLLMLLLLLLLLLLPLLLLLLLLLLLQLLLPINANCRCIIITVAKTICNVRRLHTKNAGRVIRATHKLKDHANTFGWRWFKGSSDSELGRVFDEPDPCAKDR